MNKVFLIGNLTKDPELTTTTSGIPVCKYSIAVTRKFSQNETDFFNIVVWRAPAENCFKYLKKGNKVAISGAIQNRNYEGNDGIKRYTTEIVADEVQFLTNKNAQDTSENNSPEKGLSDLQPVDDDNVPF